MFRRSLFYLEQILPCVQHSNSFCHGQMNWTISKLLVERIPHQSCYKIAQIFICSATPSKKTSWFPSKDRHYQLISLRLLVLIRPTANGDGQLAKASRKTAAVQQMNIQRKSAGNITLAQRSA